MSVRPQFLDFFPNIGNKKEFEIDVKDAARELERLEGNIKENERKRFKWKTLSIIASVLLAEAIVKGYDSFVAQILNYEFAIGIGSILVVIAPILWSIKTKRITELKNIARSHEVAARDGLGISLLRLASSDAVALSVEKDGIRYDFDPGTLAYTGQFDRRRFKERIQQNETKRL
ncbi:hypothetical protein [Marinobacter sp.]|uniref:hypothetical protein n=1 Tax=Marinobacter sp. TaxID=50741 RepID=UPI00261722D3|nr:hypothetical protein [Marinobacter sp.]